ncbi:Hypothetical predicted protein [Paramuricea clavata]|uniref:Uncharacterized protein n=1 Tax=Paramuricea clavata TaxID=317549 RepID=A0A6S7IWK4_PARCT|nr:Hypothetical predicted protein [Paramuricea clavata]
MYDSPTLGSTRDSDPSEQEPRRAACNNSRRGIRRAPARKTNERRHDSGHNIKSPLKKAPHPLGCLSPNKEFSTDAGEPSQQYLQGHGDKLHDNDSEQGEYSRLTTQTSSETSSLTSLHSSLDEHHKENNTRDQMSEVASSHELSVKSENLIEVKDVSGVKRKLSESDMSDATSTSGRVKKRKNFLTLKLRCFVYWKAYGLSPCFFPQYVQPFDAS